MFKRKVALLRSFFTEEILKIHTEIDHDDNKFVMNSMYQMRFLKNHAIKKGDIKIDVKKRNKKC